MTVRLRSESPPALDATLPTRKPAAFPATHPAAMIKKKIAALYATTARSASKVFAVGRPNDNVLPNKKMLSNKKSYRLLVEW